jgi:hypothetical protein
MVDVLRIGFFFAMTWLTVLMMQKMGNYQMTIIDLPMNIVYGVCLFGFAAMALRSVWVAKVHWQRGYSVLERPEPRCSIAEEPRMLKISVPALMAGGIPVAIAMAGSSLVYILVSGDLPAFAVVHRMIGGIDSFPLLAVPFFILAGNLMNNAGITNRIYNFALALVGWLKGGLGHVNVVGSVIFAGMSGTAIADAAGLGTVEIKAMKDHGYAAEFAVGVTAASRPRSGPDHSAEPAVRHLRDDGQRVGGRAVPGRAAAGHPDGAADDGHGGLLRAQEQLGRRREVQRHALRQAR